MSLSIWLLSPSALSMVFTLSCSCSPPSFLLVWCRGSCLSSWSEGRGSRDLTASPKVLSVLSYSRAFLPSFPFCSFFPCSSEFSTPEKSKMAGVGRCYALSTKQWFSFPPKRGLSQSYNWEEGSCSSSSPWVSTQFDSSQSCLICPKPSLISTSLVTPAYITLKSLNS